MIHRNILLLLTMMLCGFTHAAKILTQSPDGGLAVTFQINKGIPYYKVSWQKEEVLSLSRMGYVLADGALDQDFKVVGVKRNSHDAKWHELYGEEDSVRSHYNETTVINAYERYTLELPDREVPEKKKNKLIWMNDPPEYAR